ncbi:MAG: L-histidine N(alpha)-methyltransferase [Candidatus Saccharibacteria bacterium]
MKYYKNTELAELYHVSEKSVRNWIDAASAGKLDLELYEKSGRFLIANTTKNLHIIEELVERRKKFKNTRGHKIVSPKSEFYELYNDKQILDIMTNIDVHREIPLQYSYFDGGAKYWSEYSQKLLKEKVPNMLTSIMKLFDVNEGYIDAMIAAYGRVNIIDLGVGDASPMRKLLTHIQKKGKLNRYIGVDFSSDMLTLAENNIKAWFGDSVPFEGHVCDIGYDRFDDILRERIFEGDKDVINVVVLIGGTLTNFRDPEHAIRVINASLGKNDYFIYGLKLDTESSRRYFDFNVEADARILPKNQSLVPGLLNLDESFYEIEQYYDEKQRARFARLRLKFDVTINFIVRDTERHLSLSKGETILVWRYWHQGAMDVVKQFDQSGFDLMQTSLTEDKEYLLAISKVKVGQAT